MPTVVELKKALREKGLLLTGDKATLSARLERSARGGVLNSNRSSRRSVGNIGRALGNLRMNATRTPLPRQNNTRPQFGKMTVAQLKDYLKHAGRSTTGLREELERRARSHFEGRPASPPKRTSPKNVFQRIPEAVQRAAFERAKAECIAALDEYMRLPPWSSPTLTVERLSKSDKRRVDLLRTVNFALSDIPFDETANSSSPPLVREMSAFVRVANAKWDALVDQAPPALRFHIVA